MNPVGSVVLSRLELTQGMPLQNWNKITPVAFPGR